MLGKLKPFADILNTQIPLLWLSYYSIAHHSKNHIYKESNKAVPLKLKVG